MRDYAAGALEALSWVRGLIKNQNVRCQGCQAVLETVEHVLDRLELGLAVDFSRKIELTA